MYLQTAVCIEFLEFGKVMLFSKSQYLPQMKKEMKLCKNWPLQEHGDFGTDRMVGLA